jgi:hypothetical protein
VESPVVITSFWQEGRNPEAKTYGLQVAERAPQGPAVKLSGAQAQDTLCNTAVLFVVAGSYLGG